MASVVAIDLGTKKTGFASTDGLRLSTQALPPRRVDWEGPELLTYLEQLIDERGADTLLLGHPLNADGSAGPQAELCQRFGERLSQHFPNVRVLLYDEHLTTKAAEALLREEGWNRAKQRELRDSYSALILLRDWIESGEPS